MPDILAYVKSAMQIFGDAQDGALSAFIDEVTAYLKDAGVTDAVLKSDQAKGIICRGVIDLWNYGPGEAKLSDYFMQRATQLALMADEVPAT